MEHLIRSLKLAWRSERLLIQNEIRLGIKKVQLGALAGLVAVIGLVMLNVAAFFAFAPLWGEAWAALTVAGIDLGLAVLMLVYAGSIKPAPELEMIKEVRDMALTDAEEEIALAEAEFLALKDEVSDFIHNPMEKLLPNLLIPLLGAIARGFGSVKK
ncbi:MAG: phage holin family protein [Pseudomonadales bacterium]